jgi:N-acyl-D-aspartate/D-glutamate deacylase
MLKLVRDADRAGRAFMTTERAVERLTGEIARWLGIDVGTLQLGAHADLVIIDPAALDDQVEALHEATMPEFGDLSRLVRRNDAAVRAVVIQGRVAYLDAVPAPELGHQSGFGRLLRAQSSR